MEEKKPISYLNGKVWYRAIKTIFLLTAALTYLLIALIIIFYVDDPIDKDSTRIVCLLGDHKEYTATQLNLTLGDSSLRTSFDYKKFFQNYNDIDIEKILQACAQPELRLVPGNFDIYLVQKETEINNDPTIVGDLARDLALVQAEIDLKNTLSFNKSQIPNYNVKIFDIHPKYKSSYKYILLFEVALGFWFTIELIRRLFYYIALGTIFPAKRLGDS